MRICKYIIIVSCLLISTTVYAKSRRFTRDFSVPMNDKEEIDPKIVPFLKAYLSAYEDLAPYVKDPSATEKLIETTHICNNDSNPVVKCEQETVGNIKDLDVDAIPVAAVVATEATVDPKATPTPKP